MTSRHTEPLLEEQPHALAKREGGWYGSSSDIHLVNIWVKYLVHKADRRRLVRILVRKLCVKEEHGRVSGCLEKHALNNDKVIFVVGRA